MQHSTLAKRGWTLLFMTIGAFYIWGLGAIPLVGPDEPRYAEVAREMLLRHDLVTPTLGGMPWFEKPPLLYWLMILSYRVCGISESAARLGPAVCGLLSAVFIYWICQAMTRSVVAASTTRIELHSETGSSSGRWSAFVWLSSVGALIFSRAASFDIVLTMTITGALACFFVGNLKEGTKRQTLVLAGWYFFTGLSLLAKGLVGPVIVFGVIGLYCLLRRELPARSLSMSLIWGLPLALAVAAIWYVPMILRHGVTFVDQFIVQQHFARFVTNRYHHPGPLYFYLPVAVGIALPWTVGLIANLLSSRRWNWHGDEAVGRLRVFALAWFVFPVIFFSFSQSKLPAYILPALPAVALLAGEHIECLCRARRGEQVLRWSGLVLIVVAATGFWYTRHHYSVSLAWLLVASAFPVAAGTIALSRPSTRGLILVLIGICTLISAGVGLKYIAPSIAKEQSVRDLLSIASEEGFGSTPVVQLHTNERTAEFYAANRISYRADGEPVKYEDARQVIEAARLNQGVVLCLVPLKFDSQLTALTSAKTQRIADNSRVALFVVRIR